MGNNWIEALKLFNESNGGNWCVPKKGSEEYNIILSLMEDLNIANGGNKTAAKKAVATPKKRGRPKKAVAAAPTAPEAIVETPKKKGVGAPLVQVGMY